mmetsp:Transcript_87235/g.281806  ORF Transcript_87235/g.281806 Transcript_87235/m.281806 type:complete len:329 (+) Transcript_87235:251-1237(+)
MSGRSSHRSHGLGTQLSEGLVTRTRAAQLRREQETAEAEPEIGEIYDIRGIAHSCCRAVFRDVLRVLWGPSGRACVLSYRMAAETCTGRNWEVLVLVPTSPNDVGIVQRWRPELNRGRWPSKGSAKGSSKGLASVWPKAWVPPPCERPVKLDTGGEDVCLTVAFCMAASEAACWAPIRRMACSGVADLAWLLRHLGMTDARRLLRLIVSGDTFYNFVEDMGKGFGKGSTGPSRARRVSSSGGTAVDFVMDSEFFDPAMRRDFKEHFETAWPWKMVVGEQLATMPWKVWWAPYRHARHFVAASQSDKWGIEMKQQAYLVPSELFANGVA